MPNIKNGAFILFFAAFASITQYHGSYGERKELDDVHTYVVGGEKAQINEFPYMALLGYKDGQKKQWICGGTLVTEEFVMTAAHCLYSPSYGPVVVVKLGVLNTNDKNVQQIDVIERIPHPAYDTVSRYNDIGFLKLKDIVKRGQNVQPACLFTGDTIPTSHVIATGWGSTDFGGEFSDDLLKVDLNVLPASRCKKAFQKRLKHGFSDKFQVCAGSDESEADTCEGDSGGPIQIRRDGYCKHEIVGITSFGISCGHPGIPAIYTRIFPYVTWIGNTIRQTL